KIASALEKAINSAIDDSGISVDHVKVSSTGAGVIGITSGTKGSESKVTIGASVANSVITNMFRAGTAANAEQAAAAATGGTSTAGQWKASEALAGTEKIQVTINGKEMSVTAPTTTAG
ncbi:hypothetical protein LWT44_23320, partial [Enterobacter hormaechei]|nr:hypothetical protein [Enterobacter hormaechei]